MDILLALGPVTRVMIDTVIHKMLDDGLRPELVRINTTLLLETDFVEAAVRSEALRSASNHKADDMLMQRYIKERKQNIIDDAFGEWPSTAVHGVIRYASNGLYLSDSQYLWLLKELGFYHEHVVHVGDNAEPWIDSTAYGSLEVRSSYRAWKA